MRSRTRLKPILLYAAILLLFSGYKMARADGAKPRQPSKLKKVALIVTREFMPDSDNQCEEARHALAARLGSAAEYELGEDGRVAIVGARVIADVAGYEFDPILPLGKGQKPNNLVKKIPGTTDTLLLVRVSTREILGAPIGGALVSFADAALYNQFFASKRFFVHVFDFSKCDKESSFQVPKV